MHASRLSSQSKRQWRPAVLMKLVMVHCDSCLLHMVMATTTFTIVEKASDNWFTLSCVLSSSFASHRSFNILIRGRTHKTVFFTHIIFAFWHSVFSLFKVWWRMRQIIFLPSVHFPARCPHAIQRLLYSSVRTVSTVQNLYKTAIQRLLYSSVRFLRYSTVQNSHKSKKWRDHCFGFCD